MLLNPYKHQLCVEVGVVITHAISKLSILMSCLIRSEVSPPQHDSTQAALLNIEKSIEDLLLRAALRDSHPAPAVYEVGVNRQVPNYHS